MRTITDADGRDLPPPEPSSDLATLERMLLFLRRNNYRIMPGPVRVGSITVAIEDLSTSKGSELADLGAWAAAGVMDQ